MLHDVCFTFSPSEDMDSAALTTNCNFITSVITKPVEKTDCISASMLFTPTYDGACVELCTLNFACPFFLFLLNHTSD